MQDYLIAETFTLPSKGKLYSQDVNPNVKLRSMTTNEEMKRLGKTDYPYKLLSEIIDDCLIESPGISAYDLCIGDFQFLLHKLRCVTYGSEYSIESICPICGKRNNYTINLDKLEVIEYEDGIESNLHMTLPVTKKNIDLRLQSPRMLDEVQSRTKETLAKASKFKGDPAILFNLVSIIEKVDGQVLDGVKLEAFARQLPMQDVNYILKKLDKINIGINSEIEKECSGCGGAFHSALPITSEFFRPSIDG